MDEKELIYNNRKGRFEVEYKNLIYEKEKYVARIILNRPDIRNAIDFRGQGGIVDDFHSALNEAENDDEIKVVVLKGAGPDFCAGHDLSKVGFVYGMKDKGERVNQRIRYKVDRLHFDEHFKRIFLFPKITIAQVHGHCLGEGTIFVECCDMAIAAENAQFGHPEVWLGGMGVSIVPVIIATVGLKRAMDLLTSGRRIDGTEAERIGLINKAVRADKLEEEVKKLTEKLSLLPRDGIAIGKALRYMAYEAMGLLSSFTQQGVFHAWATNMHWEEDEYNFFKARRNKGITKAYKDRDAFIEGKQT
jgi:enoyl-CoA hydratase